MHRTSLLNMHMTFNSCDFEEDMWMQVNTMQTWL